MSDTMGEAEKQGQINHIRISGKLITDVTESRVPTGKSILKSRLAVYQGDKKERMFLDVGVWCDSVPYEQKRAMLMLKADSDVVVTGKLTMRTYSGRVYVGIDATSIE